MSRLDIAVRIGAIISISIGAIGVVIQIRTAGLDLPSVVAGAFLGTVLTVVVVIATTEQLRRRNRRQDQDADREAR